MSKTPATYRAVSLPCKRAVNMVTGEVVTPARLQSLLAAELRRMQALVQWQLDAADDKLMEDLRSRDEPPNAAGLYLGLHLPKEVKDSLFTAGKSGLSRYEKIWQGEVVTALRSWQARKDASLGIGTKYVSRGWKRTAHGARPSAGAKMTLGYADAQYCYWQDCQTLHLVINGQWHALSFHVPDRFQGRTPSLPTIHFNTHGKVLFKIALMAPYQQALMSTRYVVGVDVGVTHAVALSVWDEKQQKVVLQSFLSRRVRSLQNSIKASEQQVKALHLKEEAAIKKFAVEDYLSARRELALHRAAASRKKRELAVLVGQEVAAVAFSFGNAAVVVEDLSHIANTMLFGRWNRGEMVKWMVHFTELNGSRVVKVDPAYTSQRCWKCDVQVDFPSYEHTVCPQCGKQEQRDLNASVVIARRGLPLVLKMVATRKKSSRYTGKLPKQESIKPKEVLKYPGTRRKAKQACKARVVLKKEGAPAAVLGTARNVAGDARHKTLQDSRKATSDLLLVPRAQAPRLRE